MSAPEKHRPFLKAQCHPGAKRELGGEIRAGSQIDDAASPPAKIDGFLKRLRIVGDTIAFGSVVAGIDLRRRTRFRRDD